MTDIFEDYDEEDSDGSEQTLDTMMPWKQRSSDPNRSRELLQSSLDSLQDSLKSLQDVSLGLRYIGPVPSSYHELTLPISLFPFVPFVAERR